MAPSNQQPERLFIERVHLSFVIGGFAVAFFLFRALHGFPDII